MAKRGRKLTTEHRKKISEAIKKRHENGKQPKVRTCPKCKVFLGENHDCEESREKMRETKLKNPVKYWEGKKRSPETIQRWHEGFKEWSKNIPKGPDHHGWKGGTSAWYHKEARRIMSAHLGRELTSEDIVHHIDGNWKNNSLNNLQLTDRSEHMRIHLPELLEARNV